MDSKMDSKVPILASGSYTSLGWGATVLLWARMNITAGLKQFIKLKISKAFLK